MQAGVFMHYFIDGVKPLWEDDQCKEGGRVSCRVPKHLSGKVWEDLLLLLVGSQFDCAPTDGKAEVLGIVNSIKHTKVDTISIWHRSAKNEEVKTKLKTAFETSLNNALDGSREIIEKLKTIENE